MDAKVVESLQENGPLYIDTYFLLPELCKRKILTEDEVQLLSNDRKNPDEKNKILVNIIQEKGEKSFDSFVKALQAEKQHSGHAYVAEQLLKAKSTPVKKHRALPPRPQPRTFRKDDKEVVPKVILDTTNLAVSEQQVTATSDNIYLLTQLRQMNENINKQFVEMNSKLDTVQSTVQLLSSAMITVQERLEAMQNSLSLSSDYYENEQTNQRDVHDYTYIENRMNAAVSSTRPTSLKKKTENYYAQQVHSFNKADYVENERIAHGQSGEFWLAISKYNGSKVVIKKSNSGMVVSAKMHQLNQEINSLKCCQHPNIICLLSVEFNPSQQMHMLYFEYAENGQLKSFLQNEKARIDNGRLIAMALSVASGMVELSQKKVIHCDLRASNILIDGDLVCKIAGFNKAQILKDNESQVVCSDHQLAVRWQAPEVLGNAQFSAQSDVWSFGVFLAELFSYGSTPYPGMKAIEVKNLVLSQEIMEKPNDCPNDIYNIMKECFCYCASQRVPFTALHMALKQNQKKLGKRYSAYM